MLFRRISKISSHISEKSSVFQTKFPGNLPEAALTALIYLTKLPKDNLSTSLDIFRNNMHTSISSIPQHISTILNSNEEPKPPLHQTYSELFSRITHAQSYMSTANNLKISPEGVSEAIKVIYEYCDKGKIGFLSGDLSIELIEVMLNHISHIDTGSIEDNRDVYTKIEEFLMEHEFCLPKHGIPRPQKENPQAMFIREILIERDSPEIIMNKIKNDMELLTHSAFGLNYLTPKEHLIKLFTVFCRKIRQEQELCLRKQTSNGRKKYADLLVRNK